jgi:hypothetical protein
MESFRVCRCFCWAAVIRLSSLDSCVSLSADKSSNSVAGTFNVFASCSRV